MEAGRNLPFQKTLPFPSAWYENNPHAKENKGYGQEKPETGVVGEPV